MTDVDPELHSLADVLERLSGSYPEPRLGVITGWVCGGFVFATIMWFSRRSKARM